MDSITQIAVGIATVEAIAGEKLKNKSFLIGGILGTLPDLDVWIGKFFNYETELAFHRAFTHSLLGIVIMSQLLAVIFHKIFKDIAYKKWCWIIAATFATHILIDLFTAWGVQLLYPLPNRFSFKTIFVVDFFYTIPWIVILFFVFKNKIPSKRISYIKKGFYFSSSYLLLTILLKLYVVQRTENTIAQMQLPVEDFIIKPTFSNCIVWNIHVKTADAFYLGDFHILDQEKIALEKIDRKNVVPTTLLKNVATQKLIEVSENWYDIKANNDATYTFNDLRFGWINNANNEQQYVFSYLMYYQNEELKIAPLPKTLRDGKGAIIKIWNRILNPKTN